MLLDRVERNDNRNLAESGVEPEPPHPRWVRVDSRSQASYKFYPCFNPNSPHEWPYDLDALRGTEDWDDVISWFLARHETVTAEDVARFVREIVQCAQGRDISVKVRNDTEFRGLSLWFSMWGFEDTVCGRESHEIRAMDKIWFSVPELRRLMGEIGVDIGHGAFDDSHPPKDGLSKPPRTPTV